MSVEKAKEFLKTLKEKGADDAWMKKAAEAKTEEEKLGIVAGMAKEAGCDLTAEELKEALAGLKKEENDLLPLEDEAVEQVAGGVAGLFHDDIITRCPRCDRWVRAKYLGKKTYCWFFTYDVYQCEECGAEILTE